MVPLVLRPLSQQFPQHIASKQNTPTDILSGHFPRHFLFPHDLSHLQARRPSWAYDEGSILQGDLEEALPAEPE